MNKVLFICGKNKLRSPTAEAVFSSWPSIETDSAGVNADADVVVSSEHVLWSDTIFVMEKAHRIKLARKFQAELNDKRVVCLNIPDIFEYMQPELIELFLKKVSPYLR